VNSAVETRKETHESWRRTLGLGMVTGAADDDCSAIGTYASAGAQFGLGFSGPHRSRFR
jgi:Mn2+/Fe2+ NRAMP family transporter